MKKCFIYSLVFFFTLVHTIALSGGVAYAKKTGSLPQQASNGEGQKEGHERSVYRVPLGSDHPKTVILPQHAANGKGNKKGHEGKTYEDLYDESSTENLASAGASIAIFALLQSMGVPGSGFIANSTTGLIMPLIFGGGDNPQAEILDKLNTMKATLTHIEEELENIVDLLEALEQQLAIDTAKILTELMQIALMENIIAINSVWENYRYLYHNDEWVTSKDKLNTVMHDTLDSDKQNLPLQLLAIHEVITGGNIYSQGVLHLLAVELALKVNAGGDPLLHYKLLESYFGMLLKAESRAATLMVESLHYREASSQQPESGVESYNESAEFFMDRYVEKINDQVEHFLNAVEYFVTKTAHPTKSLADFVPDADRIFMRADLIAAFLSTLHRPDPDSDLNNQKMIVYRVIGSPLRVAEYGAEFYAYDIVKPFSPMLYENANQPHYDIPTYKITSHHSWSELNTSPYVQFHLGVLHGTVGQSGVISDASEIWIDKYYTDDVYSKHSEGYAEWVSFHLNDFKGHSAKYIKVLSLNSNGVKVTALWATNTAGHPGAYYVMQTDGNFVIYEDDEDGNKVALWATGTNGFSGAYYEMQDTGNFVIMSKDGEDVLWESGTTGNPGADFTMQSDGNFVIYDNKNNTHIYYAHALDIQHPPAKLRGQWVLNYYHNHYSDLESIAVYKSTDPSDTLYDPWVNPTSYLHVNAWPTITWYDIASRYIVSGSFLQEVANVGYYKWAGNDYGVKA